MTLVEKLNFCRVCTKRAFDIKTGIFCSLTNNKPSFEKECDSFVVDKEEAQKLLVKKQKQAQTETTEIGFFAPEKRGMKKGVLGGVTMIIIAVVWFVVGWAVGYIFYYPPILAVIGIVAVIKGVAEKNLSGEKYNKGITRV